MPLAGAHGQFAQQRDEHKQRDAQHVVQQVRQGDL